MVRQGGWYVELALQHDPSHRGGSILVLLAFRAVTGLTYYMPLPSVRQLISNLKCKLDMKYKKI